MKQLETMMEKYIKQFPWCPLALLITGVVMLVLWILLGARVILGLWFLIAVVTLVAGGFGIYMTHTKGWGKPKKPKIKKIEPKPEAPKKEESEK